MAKERRKQNKAILATLFEELEKAENLLKLKTVEALRGQHIVSEYHRDMQKLKQEHRRKLKDFQTGGQLGLLAKTVHSMRSQ